MNEKEFKKEFKKEFDEYCEENSKVNEELREEEVVDFLRRADLGFYFYDLQEGESDCFYEIRVKVSGFMIISNSNFHFLLEEYNFKELFEEIKEEQKKAIEVYNKFKLKE